ncbi:MAG TPA: GNAT family N-acetyltransferase [Vicinamibacterales bacterium]|nr:GNAT family N-acetyltransferase [Vicinamibacterales bacterium]
MAGIRIVPAQASDVPVILEMIKALAEYEQLTHEVVATEDDLRQSLFGPRPAAEVVLAYAGDAPIGFALFFHNFSTFLGRHGLYLEDLFVVPEWRGKGVGKQLLAHIASIADSRNCGRMEWAVLDWNESAIAFYRRMGAHVLDEWRLCRLTGHELRAASTRT